MSVIEISAGMLVRVVQVNHPVFAKDIGEIVRVTQLLPGSHAAWCRPTKLFPRKTRKGVVLEPANWDILRDIDFLEPYFGPHPETLSP